MSKEQKKKVVKNKTPAGRFFLPSPPKLKAKKWTKEPAELIKTKKMKQSLEVYKGQISKRHYKGISQIVMSSGEMAKVAKWENSGIEYLIKTSDLEKMKHKKPQAYVEAKNNIRLLTRYFFEQQVENEGKAIATFTLGDYLKSTGYSDKDTKQGGGAYDLAKQVLESGAYTRFRFRSRDGKWGLDIMGSFYTLAKEGRIDKKTGEIKGKGTKYTIYFNNPYAGYLEKWLQEGGQFYQIPQKFIADRYARKNPILYNFIEYLIFTKGGRSTTIKIINLLRKVGVKTDELKRKPECFERLRACLAYIHKNYPELLESIKILNENREGEGIQLSLSGLEKCTLQEFSGLIKAVGGKDLRECHITLYHGKEKTKIPERTATQKESDGELIERILAWAENWEREKGYEIRSTQKEREKFLLDYIRQVPSDSDYGLEKMFNDYANRDYPDALKFLMEVLPAKLKEYNKHKISKRSSLS